MIPDAEIITHRFPSVTIIDLSPDDMHPADFRSLCHDPPSPASHRGQHRQPLERRRTISVTDRCLLWP